MKNLLIAAMSALLLAHANAQGDLYSNDFDAYTTGNLLSQDGWIQLASDATNPIKVLDDPLNPGEGNQVLRLGGPNSGTTFAGQDLLRSFDGATAVPYLNGGSVQVDFTLTLRKVQTGDFFFAFAPTSTSGTSQFFGKVFAKTDGLGGFLLGLSPANAAAIYGTTSLDLDTPYGITLSWEFLGGIGHDLFTLQIDGEIELTTTWTENTALPSQLTAFILRQGSATAAPLALLDEMGIIYDVPEPASLTLCLLSAGLFFAQTRRARRRK